MKKFLRPLILPLTFFVFLFPNIASAEDSQFACNMLKLGAGVAIMAKQDGLSVEEAYEQQLTTLDKLFEPGSSSSEQTKDLWAGALQHVYRLEDVSSEEEKQRQFERVMNDMNDMCLEAGI